jgi:hypothetical protein
MYGSVIRCVLSTRTLRHPLQTLGGSHQLLPRRNNRNISSAGASAIAAALTITMEDYECTAKTRASSRVGMVYNHTWRLRRGDNDIVWRHGIKWDLCRGESCASMASFKSNRLVGSRMWLMALVCISLRVCI